MSNDGSFILSAGAFAGLIGKEGAFAGLIGKEMPLPYWDNGSTINLGPLGT